MADSSAGVGIKIRTSFTTYDAICHTTPGNLIANTENRHDQSAVTHHRHPGSFHLMQEPWDQDEPKRGGLDGADLFIALLFLILILLAIFPEVLIW